jgi:hypothetical protein
VLVIAGAGVALAAGLGIAWVLATSHHGEAPAPPPASRGGLVIDSAGTEDARMDQTKPLRCFVAGQFVGELTLAACAKRNGVATDALDVGLDETGALAAADQAGAAITPLPPDAAQTPDAAPAEAAQPLPTVVGPQAAVGPPQACWRYADAQWRRLPGETPLGACVQILFAGRCERPGGATYGRWGQETLRLTPGRVEVSADNHSFRTLVEQGPGCAIPPVG